MKLENLKFTCVIAFIALIVFSTISYATETAIKLDGDETIAPGEVKNLVLKMNCEESVGVIEGTINCDSNIQIVNIGTEYNGWTITYNEENGKFIAMKPDGAKESDVLQMSYQLKDDSSEGQVKINNVKLTTISYDIKDVSGEISKIVKLGEVQPVNSDTENSENSNSTESADNGKSTGESTSTTATDASSNLYTAGDSTTAKTILPNTGKTLLVIAIITIIIINVALTIKKLKEYEDVK